jgi:hypothetical protein
MLFVPEQKDGKRKEESEGQYQVFRATKIHAASPLNNLLYKTGSAITGNAAISSSS